MNQSDHGPHLEGSLQEGYVFQKINSIPIDGPTHQIVRHAVFQLGAAIHFHAAVAEIRDTVDLVDLVASMGCSHSIRSRLIMLSHRISMQGSQIKCQC